MRKKVVQKTVVDDEDSRLQKAILDLQRAREEKQKFPKLEEIADIRSEFKKVCAKAKRETQKLDQERSGEKRAGTTRSGTRRGIKKQSISSNGLYVNKGMNDALKGKFDKDDQEFIVKELSKVNKVWDLEFEHIKYLILHVFLEELKSIQQGKLESHFHTRFVQLKGKNKADLLSEVRASLFKSKDRDYINGLLQGAFDNTVKDEEGNIKYSEIEYVEIVMYPETLIRIVKYVHKFKSNEEALTFMIEKSLEENGLGGD